MYGSYSGIFGVRIQTKCQKVSVLVSDPRHLETIIIRTSLFGTEGKNPTFGVTRIPIDTLQLWTPILFSSKLESFCTETCRNSSEDTKNVIFVNCADFESANF